MGIKVIICKVGEAPVAGEKESTLEASQAIVGGLIECVQLNGDYSGGVDLWCNEEGLFTCKPNRLIGRVPINGDFFIARHNAEGDTISLTDEDIDEWLPFVSAAPIAITSLC